MGVGEAADHGASGPDGWVGDIVADPREKPSQGTRHHRLLEAPVADQRSHSQRLVTHLESIEFGDAVDVYQPGRALAPVIHVQHQALAPGEYPGLSGLLGQCEDRFLWRGPRPVIERRGLHELPFWIPR